MARAHDLEIHWTHFPLHPEIPPQGCSLGELFPGRETTVEDMRRRLDRLAKQEGLPLEHHDFVPNTRLAQELGAWADTREGGGAIHDALFRAYFVDGRDLGDIETLVEIAEAVGLDAEETREVLTRRTFRERVDEDWRRSREMGITGVPTFLAGRHAVVGAQPYEVLERLVAEAGWDGA